MDIYKPVQLLWYIKTSAPHYRALIGDSYRIQTCNLLIRSQMLYSVELRSHVSYIRTFTLNVTVFIGDSYRIQTCNLLIRSQMLYSVELRSLAIISDLRLQNYCFFLNPQNFRGEKFSQFLI